MLKSEEENFFYFPPYPDIPEIEYLSLATDLIHLCLDTSLTPHESDPNRWFSTQNILSLKMTQKQKYWK